MERRVSQFSNTGNPVQCVSRLGQDFVVDGEIGTGGFGKIFKANRKSDKNDFAIKIIKFDSKCGDVKKNRREAVMLSRLHHPNIVRYYDSWTEMAIMTAADYKKFQSESEESLSAEIKKLWIRGYINASDYGEGRENEDVVCENEDEINTVDSESQRDSSEDVVEINYLFIQMELCTNRTLRQAIEENLCLDETKLDKYFMEICEGLAYIHRENIVHRDLKPENIFLTTKDVIKIGDFGLSKQISTQYELVDPTNTQNYGSLTETCGTSVYIAPELYSGKTFTKKADIYSLGVTYFEMCCKPMMGHEKQRFLGKSSIQQQLQTVNFETKHKKTKVLIGTLLHTQYEERPTCEEILKILHSEKSISDIREFIKKNRKVPFWQFRHFERNLHSTLSNAAQFRTFLTQTAVKIFELHGGENIPMPTFLPSFSQHSEMLSNLLYTRGNATSVSNTSRCAFAYCVARCGIKDMRRYSVGKVFEEGNYYWPNEKQECLFQIVSSQENDFFNDAEVLYIAEEVHRKLFPNSVNNITFFINHRFIFSTILEQYKINGEKATIFTDLLLKNPLHGSYIYKLFEVFKEDHILLEFIKKVMGGFNCHNDFDELLTMFQPSYSRLVVAVNQLKAIVKNANAFGIRSVNIILKPLLITEKRSTGFMFYAVRHEDKMLEFATGGRFEKLIQHCCQKGKRFAGSATEISFNFNENVPRYKFQRTKRVIIVTEDKTVAVPLFKAILENGISCKVVTQLIMNECVRGTLIIHVNPKNKEVVLCKMDESGSMKKLYEGNLMGEEISQFLARLTL